MKRIIFDVDDTLIMWENEYWKVIENTFNKLNLNYNDDLADKIKTSIALYRKEYDNMTKEMLLSFINEYTSEKFTDEFIDILLDEISSCAEEASNDIIETLEYLKDKYNLVILSDWFGFMQERRLNKSGILKYFNKIFGPALTPLKPHPNSFLTACEEYDVSECIMIGDNYECDIKGADSVGMKAIFCNFRKKDIETSYPTITEFKELKELL